MKTHEELLAPNICLVMSYEEAGYQRVLGRFPSAKTIEIATYNISDQMISCIKALSTGTLVRLVVNIPGRFDNYYPGAHTARAKARKIIDDHRRTLHPTEFVADVRVFFNFENHSKIVIADDLAYVGSANLSHHSARSVECGVIIDSSEAVEKVRNVFEQLVASSTYYGGDDDELENLIYELGQAFRELGELREAVDFIYERKRLVGDRLTMANFIMRLAVAAETLRGIAEDAPEGWKREVRMHLQSRMLDQLESWPDGAGKGARLFAEFDPDEESAHMVGESGCFEEELDEYAEAAAQSASEREADLQDAAEQALHSLGSTIDPALNALRGIINELKEYQRRQNQIDNT